MKAALLWGMAGASIAFLLLVAGDSELARECPDFEIEYERNALAALAIGVMIVGFKAADRIGREGEL